MLEHGTNFARTKAAFPSRRGERVSPDVFTSGSAPRKQMSRKHSLEWRMLDISSQDNFMPKRASCATGPPPPHTFTRCLQTSQSGKRRDGDGESLLGRECRVFIALGCTALVTNVSELSASFSVMLKVLGCCDVNSIFI